MKIDTNWLVLCPECEDELKEGSYGQCKAYAGKNSSHFDEEPDDKILYCECQMCSYLIGC